MFEKEMMVRASPQHRGILSHLSDTLGTQLRNSGVPIRLAITASDNDYYQCEVGVISESSILRARQPESIFRIAPRRAEDQA